MPKTATKTTTTKAPKQAKTTTATKQTKPAKAPKQDATTSEPTRTTQSSKRGKTLQAKLMASMFNTIRNDLLGPRVDAHNTSPGVLAQVLASGEYKTAQDYENVLREWLDDRFGHTHKISGFFMFSNANRASISAELGTKDVSAVGKELGVRWRALSAEQQAEWKARAGEHNADHAVRDFTPATRRGSGESETSDAESGSGSSSSSSSSSSTKQTKPRSKKTQVVVTDDGSESSEISSDSE